MPRTSKVERRTIPCEFRVSDAGKPTIFGYAAKFGVRSDDLGGWVEVLAPTAFDAHLATNPDVRALWNDLITSMKRGDVKESSFGFMCRDASWSFDEATGMDVRTVKDAELYDVSPVTFPAYPQATSGVRSLPADMPMEVRAKLAKRDDTDGLLDNGCECDCDECQENRCDACSNPDCVDERCVGNHSRSWRELTELRIQVAQRRAA